MIGLIRKLIRWFYRDSDTGRFLSKAEFDKRDPKTTTRERAKPKRDLR